MRWLPLSVLLVGAGVAFNNPAVSWAELRRALSGELPAQGEGGDSPAWSRKREGYAGVPEDLRGRGVTDLDDRVPYAELHAHSYFSFLDGASSPEALVEEAARAGLDAITLTDHDGMYGVVRFADAAAEVGIRVGFGAELSLGLSTGQNGVADPEGEHLLVLARGVDGYRRVCRVISSAHLRGEEKGRPVYDIDEVVEELRGHSVVLTGCRKGALRRALVERGPQAALGELDVLVDRFGAEQVMVELTEHGLPEDSTRNDLLVGIAAEVGVATVATNAVHYATPKHGRLAAAMAAVRARRSLEEMDGWLPPAPAAFIRSGAEMQQRFRRYPGAVQRAVMALCENPQSCSLKFPSRVSYRRGVCAGQRPSGDGLPVVITVDRGWRVDALAGGRRGSAGAARSRLVDLGHRTPSRTRP